MRYCFPSLPIQARIFFYLLCVTLIATPNSSWAEFSGKLELKNNRTARGIQRSTDNLVPVAQLSYDTSWGGYAGASATKVDFGNGSSSGEEFVYFAGYGTNLSPDLNINISYLAYDYQISSPRRDYDWEEWYLRLVMTNQLALSLGYSDNWIGWEGSSPYLEFSYLVPISSKLGTQWTLGQTFAKDALGENFLFLELGIIYSVNEDIYVRANLSGTSKTTEERFRDRATEQFTLSIGYLF